VGSDAGQLTSPASVPGRLLVSVLALGAVAGPFVLRSLDDNRLVSWDWVFRGQSPGTLYLIVSGGILLANALAGVTLPRRWRGPVLLVAAYGAAACMWSEPEVIVDASRTFLQAKYLAVHGPWAFLAQWGREVPAWTDLPLVPFLHGIVLHVLGESRTLLQAFTAALFAGAVVLTHRLGAALFDEEVGFTAGALLLASPYLLTQVPLLLADVPTMFFFTLALLAVVRALERGGTGPALLAAAALVPALLSKYSVWLLASVVPVALLVLRRAGAPRPLRTGAVMALATGAAMAALLLSRPRVFAGQVALLLGFQAPGLHRWGESFLSTFLFQVHPFVAATALASVGLAVRRRDLRYAIVLWPVLLLVGLQTRRARYLLPTFPMLALMGAYGLQWLRSAQTRRLAAGCAVASSLAVALHGYLPFLAGNSLANLRGAGEYLDTIPEERAEVLAPVPARAEVHPSVAVPLLDLYTRKRIVHLPGPIADDARASAERSPLRFTWEVRSPGLHAPDADGGPTALVLVADDLRAPLPAEVEGRLAGHRLERTFTADDGIFRFRTLVGVYRRTPGEP
jgi:hypothetical protein